MALRALAFAHARLELTLVRINRVAIHALGECQWLLEVSARMTIDATDFQMAARKRIFCFRMVKLHRRTNLFPACRGVTRLTGSLETSSVRIRVAIAASLEFNAAVLHRFIRTRRKVAFFAGHLCVHTGERVLRFRMVELLGLLPVRQVVTALAVIAELSFVDVLVAAGALLGKPHVRRGKILVLDQGTQGRNHVCGRVALLTGDSRMFFHQRITSQSMIELLHGFFPVNQRKILAIVFQVAANAILAVRVFHPQLRVIALIRGQPVCDFLMAFKALKGRGAGPKLMARPALRGTVEGFVCFGERTW